MARVDLVPTTTITTALTGSVLTSGGYASLRTYQDIVIQATFTYGSGGTTAKAWVQMSFDAGTTWVDVANFAFTTASATRIHALKRITAVAANYTPTDAALADNTITDGLLGARCRVKVTTTGTYGGSTTLKVVAQTG